MADLKNIKMNTIIDLNEYHNNDTGEVLGSELEPGTVITVKENTGHVSMTYEDYSVIDSKAVIVLTQILNDSDLAKVLKMSITTKTPLNIIYNNNLPHTNESMQQYLQLKSEAKFMALIRRLMKAGVLYQIKGKIHGEVRVIYMLNPFLSRKRKTFEETIFNVFSEFKLLE